MFFCFAAFFVSTMMCLPAQCEENELDPARIEGSAELFMNGEPLHAFALILDGRSYLSIRTFFEPLNADVYFYPENGRIDAAYKYKVFQFAVGDEVMFIDRIGSDDNIVHLNDPVFTYGGDAYVPLRTLCEELHIFPEWNANTWSINMIVWDPYIIPR